MKKQEKTKIEVEVRNHSDADFFPDKRLACKSNKIKRFTHNLREIQDLGTPLICRRVHYERVYFKCNECEEVFTIEHPLVPINARFMPGVIQYAKVRVLEKGDFIRRVTQELNELHLIDVSDTIVQRWINEGGNKTPLSTDLSEEKPPKDFSRFLSLDGTFKSVKVKKNDLTKVS